MKKIIALMLALSLLACLCACGDSGSNNDTTPPTGGGQVP